METRKTMGKRDTSLTTFTVTLVPRALCFPRHRQPHRHTSQEEMSGTSVCLHKEGCTRVVWTWELVLVFNTPPRPAGVLLKHKLEYMTSRLDMFGNNVGKTVAWTSNCEHQPYSASFTQNPKNYSTQIVTCTRTSTSALDANVNKSVYELQLRNSRRFRVLFRTPASVAAPQRCTSATRPRDWTSGWFTVVRTVWMIETWRCNTNGTCSTWSLHWIWGTSAVFCVMWAVGAWRCIETDASATHRHQRAINCAAHDAAPATLRDHWELNTSLGCRAIRVRDGNWLNEKDFQFMWFPCVVHDPGLLTPKVCLCPSQLPLCCV